MKQVPGKTDGIIRVVMDEDELRRMIQPILDEVNTLRARTAALEAHLEKLVDGVAALVPVVEALFVDYANRQDDGR